MFHFLILNVFFNYYQQLPKNKLLQNRQRPQTEIITIYETPRNQESCDFQRLTSIQSQPNQFNQPSHVMQKPVPSEIFHLLWTSKPQVSGSQF